jgi:hypothetical protein
MVRPYLEVLTICKIRPSHCHPHCSAFAKNGFSVTPCGVLVQNCSTSKQKKNGTKAALVPSLTFTCYLNSHAAGMVSAASGKNISPQFGSVTSVKKKLILKFSAVKKLFPLKIFSQIIAMLLYAYLTAVVPIFGK